MLHHRSGFAPLRKALVLVVLTLAAPAAAFAAPYTALLTVEAGKVDRVNTPIVVPLVVPKEQADATVGVLYEGKRPVAVVQITEPGLLAVTAETLPAGEVQREGHFLLNLPAGKSARYQILVGGKADFLPGDRQFSWNDTPGESTELRFGDRPVLKYMYKAFDDSTKENREETYKVFHHLYDPAGKVLVTKGPGGTYPHHRGIFYVFNNVSYEGVARADLWHCQGDHYQDHVKFLASEAGPVLGRHRVEINWHGGGKKTFAKEVRELTVYNTPGGTLVEFASKLETLVGPVKLDGDPQHAGFQFRAAQEVAEKTNKETIYIRPDGTGKPGETRNWPGDKDQVNLPWKGMSFLVGGNRYTAAYLDHDHNPKEARYSERDYGRFGSYFIYQLTEDEPLVVNYRLWLQAGEMDKPAIERLAADFYPAPDWQIQVTGAGKE